MFALDADGRLIDRLIRIGARLVFWPLILLTLIALALELGVYRTEIKIPGPFTPEAGPPYHSLILEIPRGSLATRWRQRPLGDNAQQPLGSELDLYIDGDQVRPPHSAHQAIREGTTTGFSHWENVVIFALPPDIKNGPETTVTLSYPTRPRRGLTFTLAFLAAISGLILLQSRVGLLAAAVHVASVAKRYRKSLTTFLDGHLIGRFMRIGARQAFWPLVLLTLTALALELGVYRTEIKIPGPFAQEAGPPYHSLILEIPRGSLPMWWRQRPPGDDAQRPFRSELELRIDGRLVRPPHSGHQAIRESTTTGFSHWEKVVIFALPPDLKNGPETTVTLSYPARPRRGLTFALAFLAAISGLILLQSRVGLLAAAVHVASVAKRRRRPLTTFLVGTPHLILFGLCWASLAASAVYVASSLYALAIGWALPTTALIRWSPIAEWAARNEPYFGYLLLMLAGAGTVARWLTGSSTLNRPFVETTERSLQRLLACCGVPVVVCAFVLCLSAMWAGIARQADLHYANIGGLIPFSDAGGYLSAAFDQIRDGAWNALALRRPLAAGFRSVLLVFANFSLPSMLILQACLIAGAVCFATWAIVTWRGIWAGIAFFALTYIYDRTFVPTTLTEPLGFFWALLSIPFFIEAFRHRSASAALVAFAMTTTALMTRMGSMFSILALLIWLIWQFGDSMAAKLRIGVAAIAILLAVLGLNALLLQIYGTGQSATGSNFSYIICGLTIGTGWEGCPAMLVKDGNALHGDQAAVADQLYSMAWTSFRSEPGIFFGRLAENLGKFISDFPDVIWRGYLTLLDEPAWLFRNTLTVICVLGLIYVATRRAKSVELTFWALLWASIAASSSIIYSDDGPRALAASHPLIALFFAMGMSSLTPTPATASQRPRLSRYGFAGLIVAALLFVCVPWIAHLLSPAALINATPSEKPDGAFVFGGRSISGFLVVRDDMPLHNDIPSLHLSEFESIVGLNGAEYYQGLTHPVLPPLPFGFVFAPRLATDSSSGFLYIVPAEVVERRDVPTWHFDLQRWGYKPHAQVEYWSYVTKAEPWPCTYRFREAIETGRCRN